MATEILIVQVVTDLTEYKKALAKLAPIASKEAAKAGKAFKAGIVKGNNAALADSKKKAKKAALSWRTELKKASSSIGVSLSGGFALGAAAAVASLGKIVQGIADMRNQLGDLSGQTGIAADTLNTLDFALKTSGEDLSTVTSGLKALPKVLNDFSKGTGKGADAMEALGFNVEDADALLADMDGTTKEIITRLQGVDNEGKRSALALDLLGKQGSTLIQVLGDKTIDEWNESVEVFSADVGPGAIKTAQEWQVAMATFTTTLTGSAKSRVSRRTRSIHLTSR